ncbi:MAG: flagellar hook-associated protein FlgK [Bacillota bacterium]|nr:flagellar hook-associated protein FlgK [Bacillota bacterium]
MSGSFYGLEIMKRALAAERLALELTGHNVANATTPGYSVQRPDLVDLPGVPERPGVVGGGVDVRQITRQRDLFLDGEWRKSDAQLADWQIRQQVYQQMEVALDEPAGQGLTGPLNAFWKAWNDLANNPSDGATRQAVLDQANNLVQALQQTDARLVAIQGGIVSAVQSRVDQANGILDQIAQIVPQIRLLLARGMTPNDLLDQRDRLLDQLSHLTGTTASFQPNGDLTISLPDSTGTGQVTLLATAGQATPAALHLQFDANTGKLSATDGVSAQQVGLAGGEITGYVTMLTDTTQGLPALRQRLASFAYRLATDVNAVHEAGLTADGQTGVAFFTLGSGTGTSFDLSSLQVAVTTPGGIAAASAQGWTADSPLPTDDGRNAAAIAGLANQQADFALPGPSGGTLRATPDGFLQATAATLGNQAQGAQGQVAGTQALVQQLANQRASVSGVSVDEEMVHMVQYQTAYAAAAKMVSSIDAMLGVIIGELGSAGH